jgi:hypothetical protein
MGNVTSSMKAAATDIRVAIDNRALAMLGNRDLLYFVDLAARENPLLCS